MNTNCVNFVRVNKGIVAVAVFKQVTRNTRCVLVQGVVNKLLRCNSHACVSDDEVTVARHTSARHNNDVYAVNLAENTRVELLLSSVAVEYKATLLQEVVVTSSQESNAVALRSFVVGDVSVNV